MMKSKYMLLYLKTGGGHLAPAKAVAASLRREHAETTEPILVDGLAGAPAFARWLIVDGYKHMQANAQWLYATLYFLHRFFIVRWLANHLLRRFVEPYLEKIIVEHQPEKIAIFHFLLIQPVNNIIARRQLAVATTVVVTDPFTAHPFWFGDISQRFIVFSQTLKEHCRSLGIPASHIHVMNPIVDDRFSLPLSLEQKLHYKRAMGLPTDRKLVLLIGGGDGLPGAGRIIRNLKDTIPDAALAIVCGHNTKQQHSMLEQKRDEDLENLHVFGFVDTMYEMLHSADIVVTKCGASLCMEALMSRTIPVISNYIWGQEKGNMEFITGGGMGYYEPRPARLALRVADILNNPELQSELKANIETAEIRSGATDVAEYLYRLARPVMVQQKTRREKDRQIASSGEGLTPLFSGYLK